MAYDLLSGIRGAVVVLDCQSGGVNCMVSTPSFDNDEFSKGITNEKWNQLLIDKSNLYSIDVSQVYIHQDQPISC